jgi:predicted transglutaminase-like cysteine proteinase
MALRRCAKTVGMHVALCRRELGNLSNVGAVRCGEKLSPKRPPMSCQINNIAKWLAVLLALQSPAYAFGIDKTGPVQNYTALRSQRTSKLGLLPSSNSEPKSSSDPFGLLGVAITTGEVSAKWRSIRSEIEVEAAVLARCQAEQECPAAARQFLDIVAGGRERDGLARIGVINRAINLTIVPTSDMKQWGVFDRWTPPFETLTTGRGDCEDYAIAKYAALLDAGVANEDLKLLMVHDRLADEDHAIVATRVNGSWFMLDNRWLALVPDTELPRFNPRFVLDENGVKEFVPQRAVTRLAAHSEKPLGAAPPVCFSKLAVAARQANWSDQ